MQIKNFVGYGGLYSALLYVVVTILAIVIAHISTLPLMPIAPAVWGWQITGILSILGWIIGAEIAFYIGRKIRGPLLREFVSTEKISNFGHSLPDNNIFWALVFLRIISPIDILSYAVGIFTKINNRIFLSSTIIGIIPFAFIFSYGVTLDIKTQIFIIIEIVSVLVLISFYKKKMKKHQ